MITNILLVLEFILTILLIVLIVLYDYSCKEYKKLKRYVFYCALSMQMNLGMQKLCKKCSEILKSDNQNIERNTNEMILAIKYANCDYNAWIITQKDYNYPKDFMQEYLRNLIKTNWLIRIKLFLNKDKILEAL
jgi:hypothetical protein